MSAVRTVCTKHVTTTTTPPRRDERETHLPESQRKRTNGRRNAETETDSVIHVTHVVAERDRERLREGEAEGGGEEVGLSNS